MSGCTCDATIGRHEWWCGLPDLTCPCRWIGIEPTCTEHGHLVIEPDEAAREPEDVAA